MIDLYKPEILDKIELECTKDNDNRIDLVCFQIDSNRRLVSNKHIIFYNNTESESINLVKDGNTSNLSIDLTKIDESVDSLILVLCSTFSLGNIKDLNVKLTCDTTELFQENLQINHSIEKCVEIARVNKIFNQTNTEFYWNVERTSVGNQNDLAYYVNKYVK